MENIIFEQLRVPHASEDIRRYRIVYPEGMFLDYFAIGRYDLDNSLYALQMHAEKAGAPLIDGCVIQEYDLKGKAHVHMKIGGNRE